MPQPSKFSGALSRLREAPAPAGDAVEEQKAPESAVAETVIRNRGRPTGKRSNPEFKPTTLLLREQTKRAATRLLEDKASGQDLSELVEQLLVQWMKKQP